MPDRKKNSLKIKELNLALFDNDQKKVNVSSDLNITEIDIDLVIQNPDQPRKNFNQEKLDELVKSIEANGILQPILVRKKGDKYELVFGERRYRAALQLGYTKIPVIIKENIDDKKGLLMALIENIQRDDLNPLEEANSYADLIKTYNMTQEELSKIIGKSRVAVANTLRLIKLPDHVKKLINQGKITEGHARAILHLKTPELQVELGEKIVNSELSVREAEEIAQKIVNGVSRETAARIIEKDEHIVEIEASLSELLGMRVSIRMKKKNSKVEIMCNSQSDLEKVINKLLSN